MDPESLFSYLLEDEIMTFSQTSEGNLRCARIFMKESTRELRQVLDPGPPGWEEASLGGAAGAADGGGSGGEDGGEDLDGQGDGGQYSGGGNYDEEEPGSPTSAEDKVRARNLATSNLTEVVSARMLEAELDARKAAVVKKLERAFDIIDADKSGDLDWGEIQDALDPDGEQGAELHEIFGSHDILAPLSALSMWEKLFALIDVNGDGTVDFDELTGYVFGLIEKKFRQIPRSGTHYLMDRIMRRGLGDFVDRVQERCKERTVEGESALMSQVRALLGRGAGFNRLMPALLKYHTRCYGKLVNVYGDFTCIKDLFVAWAEVHKRGDLLNSTDAIAGIFDYPPDQVDELSSVDQATFYSTIFRNMEDAGAVDHYLKIVDEAILKRKAPRM